MHGEYAPGDWYADTWDCGCTARPRTAEERREELDRRDAHSEEE